MCDISDELEIVKIGTCKSRVLPPECLFFHFLFLEFWWLCLLLPLFIPSLLSHLLPPDPSLLLLPALQLFQLVEEELFLRGVPPWLPFYDFGLHVRRLWPFLLQRPHLYTPSWLCLTWWEYGDMHFLPSHLHIYGFYMSEGHSFLLCPSSQHFSHKLGQVLLLWKAP